MGKSAVVVTSTIARGSCGPYMRYLTTAKRGQHPDAPRVLAYASDLGDVAQTIAAVDRFMLGTARGSSGVSVIHSYKGLDPKSPRDVRLAMSMSRELMEAGAPDQPLIQVAQGDGRGGYLHVHNIAVNHNLSTGRAARGSVMHWQWRKHNDELMDRHQDLGFERVQPGTAQQSAAERIAAARGQELTPVDVLGVTPVEDMPRAEVTAWFGAQIDELVADGSLDGLPYLGAPARTTVPLDETRSLSVWVKAPGKTGTPVITYAVVDAAGEVVAGPPSRSGRRPLLQRTQGQLDKQLTPAAAEPRYSYEALTARIEQQQEEVRVHDAGADRSSPQQSPRAESPEAAAEHPAEHAEHPTAPEHTLDTPTAPTAPTEHAEHPAAPGGMLGALAATVAAEDHHRGPGGPGAARLRAAGGAPEPRRGHGGGAPAGGREGPAGDRGERNAPGKNHEKIQIALVKYNYNDATENQNAAILDGLRERKVRPAARHPGQENGPVDAHELVNRKAESIYVNANGSKSSAEAFNEALNIPMKSGKTMREIGADQARKKFRSSSIPSETMGERYAKMHARMASGRAQMIAAAERRKSQDKSQGYGMSL